MSETSSDTESSCGWTIISNEGSDIETLGSEAAGEYGTELVERRTLEEPQLLESQVSVSAALCVEEKAADSLDVTLGEQAVDETLCCPEARDGSAVREQVFSSSDHSDIVTLRDLKEDEHAEEEELEEAGSTEENYLGTSSSSHYTFTAAETGLLLSRWKLQQTLVNLSHRLRSRLPAFPAQQPLVTNSSSSDDEVGRSSTPVIRRRRVRKNTTSVVTDPEEDEEVLPESWSSEEEQQPGWAEGRPNAANEDREQSRGGNVFNRCILLALIIAVSMGFGHFYGTVQIQERQKTVEKTRGIEHPDVRGLLEQRIRDEHLTKQRSDFGPDDLDEQQVINLLSGVIKKAKEENQELKAKQVHIQAQRDNLEQMLKQTEERIEIVSLQQSLSDENIQLRSSMAREEKSLSVLQDELRNLRSQIRDLEARGAGADSLLSENQRLKEQLEEEQQTIRNFHLQREDMTAEAHMLRKKLERERKVTEELRSELTALRSHVSDSDRQSGSEAGDLEKRLLDLEKRLSYEQQRSDLWERLYVETKEEKVKGDRESTVRRAKQGVARKMKETFDAVKNSTKEFVHHHKEQIKKAKEAVKENLRKFSDSVKSTFRHFKDSASTFINKAQGFYSKKCDRANTEECWQHRAKEPRRTPDSFQNHHNTRKSAGKVLQDEDESSHKSNMKGCTGVFDCAYLESMNLFNKATEPIRAEEFDLLLQSYLQQEVDHFYHWNELRTFINGFFQNGLFIHDRMLFTDFVGRVESYLSDMHEYHSLDGDVFGDLDDYIYRHFFGEGYARSYGPRGPFQRPEDPKEEWRAKHQQRKQPRGKSRPHCGRRWSRSGRNADRHMADVKIELGPMPFDPKY
ncbi:cell cycle progression protein 1 isoform X1 [Xiphophorus couchianus]|uniref:cell cycle progression protein 1 isoform X1 n=1 Tax=Xiphophorus couchianus TaxID=32473 RepID=UPI001016DF44|nr:cell cycle progression protein 1 isoform X1 [Xiphophorus couchianus]